MDETTRKQLRAAYHAQQGRWYQGQEVKAKAQKTRKTRKMVLLALILCVVAVCVFFALLPFLMSLGGLPSMIGLMLAG